MSEEEGQELERLLANTKDPQQLLMQTLLRKAQSSAPSWMEGAQSSAPSWMEGLGAELKQQREKAYRTKAMCAVRKLEQQVGV